MRCELLSLHSTDETPNTDRFGNLARDTLQGGKGVTMNPGTLPPGLYSQPLHHLATFEELPTVTNLESNRDETCTQLCLTRSLNSYSLLSTYQLPFQPASDLTLCSFRHWGWESREARTWSCTDPHSRMGPTFCDGEAAPQNLWAPQTTAAAQQGGRYHQQGVRDQAEAVHTCPWKNDHPHSLSMGGGNKSNFTAEKSDKHHLSQLIQVNINGAKSCALGMM